MARASPEPATEQAAAPRALWLSALKLSHFRNYPSLSLDLDARPVVLTGPNGAGKTSLLEAVSFLIPGRGLRRAALGDIETEGTHTGWAVWARIEGPDGPVEVGTGLRREDAAGDGPDRRDIRIGGEKPRSASELAALCRAIWLTPAMDQIFTGPAAARRQFLDGLAQAADPAHRARVNAFDTAMRQRNAALAELRADPRLLDAIEAQMAEHGAAVAAARRETVRLLQGVIAVRGEGPFPAARLDLSGLLEAELAGMASLDAEDRYRETLERARREDAAAGRTLSGPHRADLVVFHAAHGREAARCSTGEQKMLLVGLVLAHATLVRELMDGHAPLVLLDEVAAHLDAAHRSALFAELAGLGAQAWMTGTDGAIFAELGAGAQHFQVVSGRLDRRT